MGGTAWLILHIRGESDQLREIIIIEFWLLEIQFFGPSKRGFLPAFAIIIWR